MTSSGLGWTDSENGAAIGGLARKFFHRVWNHYRAPEAWTRGERSAYGARVHAQPGKTVDDEQEVMWTFEPHVAEKIFNDWLAESGVTVRMDEWLDRQGGVVIRDGNIAEIRMHSGRSFAAGVFIDASYEGDLMAAAGVTYRLGRDFADEYHESLNGIYFKSPGSAYHEDDANAGISPYLVPGDPTSGFVPGIEGELPASEVPGSGDSRLQSFNYRLCLTNVAENRIPVEKPEGYRESDYELLFRFYAAGKVCGFSTQECLTARRTRTAMGTSASIILAAIIPSQRNGITAKQIMRGGRRSSRITSTKPRVCSGR